MIYDAQRRVSQNKFHPLYLTNIPWIKVNKKAFKEFIRDFCGRSCPDESTLRKSYLKPLYRKSIDTIRSEIGNNWIYLQVDEAVVARRILVSVVVGVLNGERPKSYCLNLVQLKSAINNTSLQQAITDSLTILWPDRIRYENVRLLVTDQASYMIAASSQMKMSLHPDMLHITCVCHALHRVCEEIRIKHPAADSLVNNFKITFAKSTRRVAGLEQAVECSLPSFPVNTRWGTWLSFCVFLAENFEDIKGYVSGLAGEDCCAIEPLIENLNSSQRRSELLSIYEIRSLISTIKSLEERGLIIREQKELIDSARTRLPSAFARKLDSCLAKNPDFERLFKLEDLNHSIRYLQSPLASVDVERCFSQLKCILTDRRQSFNETNFLHYAIVYYNSFVDQ